MSERPIFTYQTRLTAETGQDSLLEAYAALHGRSERSLFAALRAGRPLNDLKREFQLRFGITARQFNAIRAGLEGKIASIKERRPELIAEAQRRITEAEKIIAKLEARAPGSDKLHQKKRRLATLKARCASIQADHRSGTVRLCFGSKKLFRAQFNLEAHGYADRAEWKADWQHERSRQFFVLGSQDETAGNQTCQASVAEDGSLTLRLRLPNALASAEKAVEIPGVRFAYGHEQIVAALNASRRVTRTSKTGEPITKRVGTAISYRFLHDERGWRVFASVETQPVETTSNRMLGAIGIDMNADHLAVAETDRFGNLIASRRIDLNLYGKTTDQAKALIGDASAAIARSAKAAGKPVVIEALDFRRKKTELEAIDARQARMISSFAYNKVLSSFKAACFRAGVEVIEINPAYTSVIGAINHAQERGISIHQGAAYAIARRGLGFSERPAKRMAIVPARNGDHVTFALPVRNRAKHVWSLWSGARTKLRAALAAHVRSGKAHRPPAPLVSETRSVRSHRASVAKSHGANRSQHCSGNVTDTSLNVPY